MLSDKQVEIADTLLKHLQLNEGKSSPDEYPVYMQNLGFLWGDISYVRDYLANHLNLIDYQKSGKHFIILKQEGFKAAENGLKIYLEQKNKKEQLNDDAKTASIKGVRNAKIFSIVAILVSVISIFKEPLINKVCNGDYQSNNRETISNSNIPLQLTDSALIEKIKHSLKHDTLFFNEIIELNNKSKGKKN